MSRPAVLRQLAVAAAALVSSACTGHPAGTPTHASPSTTTGSTTTAVVRTFTAYTAGGAVSVPVAARTTGSCWTNSIAVPDPRAYRCLAGNQIMDPCFAPARATAPTTVACVAAPWDPATLLTVTGPLPPPATEHLVSHPWALQLANGARCVASTGTAPSVDGVTLNYVCGPDADAGTGHATGLPVLVSYGAPGGAALTRVSVTTIWDG